MRVTIDVSQSELDYIREALTHKYESLMLYLDECEQESFSKSPEFEELKKGFKVLPQQVQAMKDAGVWQVKQKRDKTIAAYAKADAPWGLKKDGTPKKKPGGTRK